MLYTAVFTKKKRLFQKAYVIEGETIYITDTKRAKEKFLKSGIKNVVFTHDVTYDAVLGDLVTPMAHYDGAFLFTYLEKMLLDLTSFLKIELPVETMAITDAAFVPVAVKYARIVMVDAMGEDEVIDGVNVIYSKRLKKMPDMAVIFTENRFPPMPGVPTVDIREGAESTNRCKTWETLSFKCDLLPYEINAKALMYLLKNEEKVSFQLTNTRKKLPPLFTFR